MIIFDQDTKQEIAQKPAKKTAQDLYAAIGKEFPVVDDGRYLQIDDSKLTEEQKTAIRNKLLS